MKHQQDAGAVIDPKSALLNAMTFVVFDGGHSMHEALWVANQTHQRLNLGLNLGDPTKPNEFVSDYEAFADKFNGNMKAAVDGAMNTAWAGTQDYMQQSSQFAQQAAAQGAAAPAQNVPPPPPPPQDVRAQNVQQRVEAPAPRRRSRTRRHRTQSSRSRRPASATSVGAERAGTERTAAG